MANTRKYEKKESFPVLIMLGDGRGGDIGEYQQFSVQRRNNEFLWLLVNFQQVMITVTQEKSVYGAST